MTDVQQSGQIGKIKEFFRGIGLCPEGTQRAEERMEQFPEILELPLEQALFDGSAERRAEGVRAVKAALGPDEDGMKVFVYFCRCSLHTHVLYEEKGIHASVYWATMKFLSRFVAYDMKRAGKPVFLWADWFHRQLSMQEFRLGSLEFEIVNPAGSEYKLFIHIPSDADLSEEKIDDAIEQAKAFFAEYFPQCGKMDMYCDSWMLVPVLQKLLPPSANILKFQNRFEILRVEEESRAVLDWICPDPTVPYEQLPEDTTLQRNIKKYLLSGGKFGWALGRLKN